MLQNARTTAGHADSDRREESSPRDVAMTCLDEAGGDLNLAANRMVKLVMADQSLRDRLMRPYVEKAVRYLLRQSMGQKRRRYRIGAPPESSAPQDSRAKSDQRLRLVAQRALDEWYDYPLPGGLKLGEATRDDLLEAIRFHREQASSNGRKASWLERVLNAMPARTKKPVKGVLSNEQIAELAAVED